MPSLSASSSSESLFPSPPAVVVAEAPEEDTAEEDTTEEDAADEDAAEEDAAEEGPAASGSAPAGCSISAILDRVSLDASYV